MRFNKVLNVVGVHAEGEVGNVVTGGVMDVPGDTMLDKRAYLMREGDGLRRLLCREPRGSVNRNINVILPTSHPGADAGYIIMESTEYPVMSGSNTICVATVLLETGILPMSEPVTDLVLESPAGLIAARCECRDGKVTCVEFTNQPAFVYYLDANIEVPGLGPLKVDVAWGGMTYVLVDAEPMGFHLTPDEGRDLREMGRLIIDGAAGQLPVVHPVEPSFPGITIMSFTGPLRADGGGLRSRNAVVVAPGRLDRSPCGTGTSARLAAMHARGQIEVGQEFVHESVLGTRFRCSIEGLTKVGDVAAIVPKIAGQAWITELSQIGVDPADPFPEGYEVTDTWPCVTSPRRGD